MKISLRALPLLLILALPFLVAFRLLADVVGIPEPWATLLFAFVVPLVVQAIGRFAPTATQIVYQAAALLLTLIFVFVSGGFAGLDVPTFPAFAGDIAVFLTALLAWVGGWLRVILASWGSVELSYQIVLKSLMGRIGFRKIA